MFRGSSPPPRQQERTRDREAGMFDMDRRHDGGNGANERGGGGRGGGLDRDGGGGGRDGGGGGRDGGGRGGNMRNEHNGRDGGGGGHHRRDGRDRRYGHRSESEPEWFSAGPTNAEDTIGN